VRLSEVKLRQVLKYFCADLTAVQAAAKSSKGAPGSSP